MKYAHAGSLPSRTFTFAIFYMGVVIGLFGILLWYGRNTYGPANNHPASVSEALGPYLNFLIDAGVAGLVALVLMGFYWLAALLWPLQLRNPRNEKKALMIGLPVTLTTAIVLHNVIMSID